MPTAALPPLGRSPEHCRPPARSESSASRSPSRLLPCSSSSMERKRKLEVYEAPPVPAAPAQANGQGIGWQQTAAPPAPDGSVNPYTGRPYSARYHQILATRQGKQDLGRAACSGAHCHLAACRSAASATACFSPLRPASAHPSAAGLPVWQAKADFINMVNSSQTIILVGETGSGKTTQIAQFIAEVRGRAGARGRVGAEAGQQLQLSILVDVQPRCAPSSQPRLQCGCCLRCSCHPVTDCSGLLPALPPPPARRRRATAPAARRLCARSRGEWRR